MVAPKKDQERVGYASLYGAQARKEGGERVVPACSGTNTQTHGCRASMVSL
ncbi:hypothetical protein [Mesorhizobium sangaii]|uniref:Uncharacterized protein n=1 Tax=Mesorhizobium sangaii TaxID=505389 RepID=A0A841P9R2_9HYPH|nr:hypothetical protein [Mesorhizobium sangaii]MBB6411896.1 hypothetical protein [Mesorhizobium sangaii]